MTQIKSFADLGIKSPNAKSFIGEQIPMKRILDKQIIIHDYKVTPSNFKGTRLDMQITFKDEKHVIWTSSMYLQEQIEQIPKDAFPFTTTIIDDNDRYLFT